VTLFSVDDRDRVRDRVLEWAAADERVVAGAVVGSLAHDDGDRWSDLDLTFGVAEAHPIRDVLEDWSRRLVDELDAVFLFDLPSGPSIYRVFLLPGCLQFDLSFTPAPEFGARGPKFRLLFGEAADTPHVPPPAAERLFGYAVHHLLRARFCLERGRVWHAEYWLSEARDLALGLACRRRGLPAHHGRGFDDLPADVHAAFGDAFARSLDAAELRRTLGVVVDGLLREADEVRDLATRVEPELRKLIAPGSECHTSTRGRSKQ
jgi:hypothetical protein